MIILMVAGKAFDKIKHTFNIKAFQKVDIDALLYIR